MPSGTSPVVTNRQSAMRSLRASATIIVLRFLRGGDARPIPLRQGAVLLVDQKRQANWIMPRRTRALPALASPFSRRLEPLSSGEPVRPA